jgi:hypothetical protein
MCVSGTLLRMWTEAFMSCVKSATALFYLDKKKLLQPADLQVRFEQMTSQIECAMSILTLRPMRFSNRDRT